MIYFNSESNPVTIKFEGSLEEIAIEYASLGKTMVDMAKQKNKMLGENLQQYLMAYVDIAFEDDKNEAEKKKDQYGKLLRTLEMLNEIANMFDEEEKGQNKGQKDNILKADFHSNEEFEKWFHGGDEDA